MATAASRRNPRDVTGRKAAVMAEAHIDELKARQGQMSTVTVAPDFDLEPDSDGPEVTIGGVQVETPMRKLRVNTDLENVTIGAGTDYNFSRGQVYNVTKHVYDHLEEKGLVWH